MPAKPIAITLNAADFPLNYSKAKRSTIANEDTSVRLPGDYFGDKVNRDYGNPQMIFCENVLPFDKGLFSVGFVQQTEAIGGGFVTADQCITLRDAQEKVYSYVPADGANYVYDHETATWSSVDPFTFDANLVSVAYVEGRTFICFERNKIIEYDSAANSFTDVVLTLPAGYSITDIRGICGASNYLLLHTEFEILWNAPGVLDEFADIDAGAGKQTPIDVKAQISAIKPIAGGYVVYTARNAIGAQYTNDATSPFSFKEIGNAGGVLSPEYVSDGDPSGNAHYIWGTAGLQRVSLTGSIVEYPQVTDFLTGKQMETWNADDKEVVLTESASHLSVKISFLANRYLVISYGQGTTYFDFALVLDTALDRWGKIRIEHQDAFMYPYPQGEGAYFYEDLVGFYDALPGDYASLGAITFTAIPPKQGLAFMNSLGEIHVAVLDFTQELAEGVIILGHLQYKHDRMITVQSLELDGLKAGPAPEVNLLLSTRGKARTSSAMMTTNIEDESEYWKFNSRKTAKNIDIAVEGTFVLSNALVTVMNHGNR